MASRAVLALRRPLAISDVGWSPNSSKQIIVLGDCPAKVGYDPIAEKEKPSITGKSLIDIMRDARPLGGSDSERALIDAALKEIVTVDLVLELVNTIMKLIDRLVDLGVDPCDASLAPSPLVNLLVKKICHGDQHVH